MAYRPTKKVTAAIAGISAVALVLTACGGSSTTTSSSSTSAATSAAEGSAAASGAASGSAAAGGGAGVGGGTLDADSGWCEKAKAEYGDMTGKTVSIYAGITAPEDVLYQNAYKPFTECTGAKVDLRRLLRSSRHRSSSACNPAIRPTSGSSRSPD